MTIRRGIDALAAGVGLLVLSPIMVTAAIAIKATSPGPVLFTQERVGLHGKRFRIHKFRTMVVDHDGIAVSASGDPRVTTAGRILRKTKLDELPQLFDVFVGNMSLIGPRPEVPEWVAKWPDDLRPIILSVRPGISDPVTVGLRDESELLAQAENPVEYYETVLLPQKAAGYAQYVKNRTLSRDFVILLKTLQSIVLPSTPKISEK